MNSASPHAMSSPSSSTSTRSCLLPRSTTRSRRSRTYATCVPAGFGRGSTTELPTSSVTCRVARSTVKSLPDNENAAIRSSASVA